MANTASLPSQNEERSTLALEVGTRLRERREELGTPLREVAATAEISASHLSDIENGRSHASLPVLLRLCRVLHLPMARLLPRLGGHRVFRSKLGDQPRTIHLSHPELELVVTNVNLAQGTEHRMSVGSDEDVFAFVLSGNCEVEIDGVSHSLGTHDALDVEHAMTVLFRASAWCSLLVCRGSRR